MNKSGYDNLKQVLAKKESSQKIIIWGASYKSDDILSKLNEWGYPISGYVDKNYINIGKYKGYPVYAVEQLKNSKYFVYVALQSNYEEVLKTLNLWGYKEFIDYWYPARIVDLDGTQNYLDQYGNQLITENRDSINVRLRNGSKIEIKSKNIGCTTKILSQGNSSVKIGENTVFGNECVISATNGIIELGNRCRFDSFIVFRVSCGGIIQLGEACTIQRQCVLAASFDARLILGKDCMVSYFVLMRAGNSHNMVDLDSFTHLDENSNRDVVIGEHVWIGMRATIMNGVTIGPGSTVGANSFVCKKTFQSNCCLVGNSAKIIRAHTAWIRDGVVIHKNLDDYSEYIYDK